jgi:hypothetical protein
MLEEKSMFGRQRLTLAPERGAVVTYINFWSESDPASFSRFAKRKSPEY